MRPPLRGRALRREKRPEDTVKSILVGIGIAVVFAVIAGIVIPGHIRVPAGVEVAALSPDFWPKVVAWGIVLLGLALAAQAWLALRRSIPVGSVDRPERAEEWLRAGAAISAMVVYYALIPYLGIVAASIPAYIAMASLMGARRWSVVVPIGVLLPVALYFFFVEVARIPLPLGIFG